MHSHASRESSEDTAGRSPVGEPAAFLFQQVISTPPALSAASKIFFAVGTAFAEQNRVPFAVPVTNP